MNATVNIDSKRASAIADGGYVEPYKLDILNALAAEIARHFAQPIGYLLYSECEPETDAELAAVCAVELAVTHMVELRARSTEELAVKAGVLERAIGQVGPIDGVAEYHQEWQNLIFSIAQDAAWLFGRKAPPPDA